MLSTRNQYAEHTRMPQKPSVQESMSDGRGVPVQTMTSYTFMDRSPPLLSQACKKEYATSKLDGAFRATKSNTTPGIFKRCVSSSRSRDSDRECGALPAESDELVRDVRHKRTGLPYSDCRHSAPASCLP
jgi:hypothetical protein